MPQVGNKFQHKISDGSAVSKIGPKVAYMADCMIIRPDVDQIVLVFCTCVLLVLYLSIVMFCCCYCFGVWKAGLEMNIC